MTLSGGSRGVVFKVGLNHCKASENLGIHFPVLYPQVWWGLMVVELMNAYLDIFMIDKSGCRNILDAWHSK